VILESWWSSLLGEPFEPVRLDAISDRVVHDGVAITSVGGAKSYDAAHYLVELLYGSRAAEGVARNLVIDWDLNGIQFRKVSNVGTERIDREAE